MNWIGSLGLAACVVLGGGLWVTAQDDCHRTHWFGGWRSSAYPAETYSSYDGFPAETYSYRTFEPNGELITDEFRTSGQAYVTRNDEPVRATTMPGLRTRPMTTTHIRLASGGDVGRIEELVISDTGAVDYMIVSFTNVPRLGSKLAAIPWGAAQVDLTKRVAILDMEQDELFNAPIFFNRGSWPNLYEGEWASKVHSHFGLDSTRVERAYRTPEGEEREGARGRTREGTQREMRNETRPAPQPGAPQPGTRLEPGDRGAPQPGTRIEPGDRGAQPNLKPEPGEAAPRINRGTAPSKPLPADEAAPEQRKLPD
jgi:hypothetical protein